MRGPWKSLKTSRRSVTRVTKYCKKLWICTIWNSSADPPESAEPADQVSSTAARTLPSTRAGGQDDVSSNKLPQIKSKWSAHPISNWPGLHGIGRNRYWVKTKRTLHTFEANSYRLILSQCEAYILCAPLPHPRTHIRAGPSKKTQKKLQAYSLGSREVKSSKNSTWKYICSLNCLLQGFIT